MILRSLTVVLASSPKSNRHYDFTLRRNGTAKAALRISGPSAKGRAVV